MTVLGIDPGFGVMGYAVITGTFPKVALSGRVMFDEKRAALDKLPAVLRAVISLVEDEEIGDLCEEPLRIAIEEAWQGSRSHQVVGKLGELVGAIKAVAIARGLPITTLPPRTWHAANGLPIRGGRDLIADRAPGMASIRAGYKVESPDESAAVLIGWTAHGMARMGRAA